jgi:hypothetical protein
VGTDPKHRRLHASWFRGEIIHFTPSQINMREPSAIEDYIVQGWAPKAPVIAPDASILAVGSCFAQYIVQHLRRTRRSMRVNDGHNVNVIAYGAGFVNTFTLRQQFEWALGERDIPASTLYVEDGENDEQLPTIKLMATDESTRATTRRTIVGADAFILTLGLSEIWWDMESQEAFFGAVPAEIYDPERHVFRVAGVRENFNNLLDLYTLLREVKPTAPIIFTLSPVPLTATFRPVSCLTANSVSKAILRVAVDELLRACDDDPLLFYWPSYEIVTEFFGPARAYGDDRRHVTAEAVGVIMRLFEKCFVKEK